MFSCTLGVNLLSTGGGLQVFTMTDIGGPLYRKTYTYIEKIDGRCMINWTVSPTDFYGNICKTELRAAAMSPPDVYGAW